MESQETVQQPAAPRRRSIMASVKGLTFTIFVLIFLWVSLRYVLAPLVIGKEQTVAMTSDTSAVETRLNQLEAKVAELENKPAAAIDLAPLEARIAALESTPKPETTDAVTAAAAPAAPPTPTIDPAEIQTIKTELQALKNTNQATLQSVLLANQIEMAIRTGKPFASELATLSALRPEMDKVIEPAEAYSITGVATLASLQEQFARAITPALDRENRSFIQNLRSLVKIRKVGAEQKGTDDEAIIARAEAVLAKGNVAQALNETKTLSAQAAKSFASWQGRAEAYLSAQTVAETLRRTMTQGTPQ